MLTKIKTLSLKSLDQAIEINSHDSKSKTMSTEKAGTNTRIQKISVTNTHYYKQLDGTRRASVDGHASACRDLDLLT